PPPTPFPYTTLFRSKPHLAHRLRHAAWLVPVQRAGLPGADLTEVAAPRALLAADEERGFAVLPALVDVGTAGLLAHGVQSTGADETLELLVFRTHRGPGPDPRRLPFDRGLSVAGFDTEQLAAFGSNSHMCQGTPESGDRQPAVERLHQVGGGRVHHLGDSDLTAEFRGQRGDTGVGDATGHDALERAEIAVAVECEPVHGHPPLDADADGSDLAFGSPRRRGAPHPGASVDPPRLDPQARARGDEGLLDPPDVLHDVDRVRQGDDRIADQLPRAVPGDAATRSTSTTGVPSAGRSSGSVRLPAVYVAGCSRSRTVSSRVPSARSSARVRWRSQVGA